MPIIVKFDYKADKDCILRIINKSVLHTTKVTELEWGFHLYSVALSESLQHFGHHCESLHTPCLT